MKFLIDAQLPRRIVPSLQRAGHGALHTLDLPLGNRTPDREIVAIANRDGRVVVTKDADFVNTFLVSGEPEGLLLVSTGNISNRELLHLFEVNIAAIVDAFATSRFVELTRGSLIVHS